MEEIHDVRQLRIALLSSSNRGTWAWWAPGDATRYRVAYLNPASYDTIDVAFQRLLVVAVTDAVITIPERRNDPWTAESFLASFGEKYAGWWAGIRPILAVFGWTSTRPKDLNYTPDDAIAIGELLTEVT